MKKFYITFGQNHVDRNGLSLKNCYTIIEAETEEEARKKMFAHPVGHNWSSLYYSAQEAGVLRFKLNYVPFKSL